MESTDTDTRPPRTWLHVLMGGALVLLGLLLVAEPEATAARVIQLTGVFLIALGFYLIAEIFVGSFEIGWGWLLAGGIWSILTGLLTLDNPQTTAVLAGFTLNILVATTVIMLGFLMAASGHGLLGTIAGVALLILGFALIFNPFGGVVSLPIVTGILSIVAGIAIIWWPFHARSQAAAA